MTMSHNVMFAPGMRILCRDAEWLITKVDFSDYAHQNHSIHCVGADDLVRGHQAIFLTQLDDIEPVDPRKTTLVQDDSNGYRLSKLFLEAQLRQIPATSVMPDLVGMGAFKPMKFQIQTVERALRQLRPRLLLADAVGLGKTIQVGMILSELMRRGRANRVLVLAKKSMLTQFQSELWNRFSIPLVRLDSEGIAKLRLQIPANKNPFEVYHRIIISIDTLKNVGVYRHFLENTRWDCVIIDEAHNVAGASIPEKHLSYRLARLLSRRTDSMLLTTATPHNGKRETFGRLISLLDPSVIPDPELKQYSGEDIKGFFFMRLKEDVREDAGENLTDRLLVPLKDTTIDASSEEEKVYEILAEMRKVSMEDNQLEGIWKNQALLQYGIYKQFLSSPESCQKTVQKRIQKISSSHPANPELPYLKQIENALKGLNISNSSRYKLLKQQLEIIGWNGSSSSPRVLMFTEYRETQDALAKALAEDFKLSYSKEFEDQPKQVLATIHGSCPDIHLMKTVEAFSTRSAMRMLLATDVASEGINLHHECHNIIHYDLPWSIITLIQRNGRIDRFGQTKNPVLRYLRVSTIQGFLKGDESIFERLIKKVEEINRLTKPGESVLKLYDPEAEERYIAEKGILLGNKNVLEKAAISDNSEAFDLESMLNQVNLDFLLSETAESQPVTNRQEELPETRFRLYSDKKFLLEGYRYLAEYNNNYLPIQESGNLMILNAPKDLCRRLGANDKSDVIFGATAIPSEAWPENSEFRLTDDPEQVALAIKAARNTSGYWSKELLCTDQHPIMQWLTERLLMLMQRGQCPFVTSPHLEEGELCFCFIGQVSSLAGTPLVVNAHAISFYKGYRFQTRSLREALSIAKFENLPNTGQRGILEMAQKLIPDVVERSLGHMRQLSNNRIDKMLPLLREEERRLRRWKNKRRELLEGYIRQLGDNHPRAIRYRKDLEEMEAYLKDREKNWKNTYFDTSAEPSTQLILVIEGKK